MTVAAWIESLHKFDPKLEVLVRVAGIDEEEGLMFIAEKPSFTVDGGCTETEMLCIDMTHMWLLKRPDMIEKVRGLEKRTGRTFFAPCVPGHHTNDIDAVLNWAKSLKRGGHEDQPAFPILYERPACESKYGLCE